MVKSCDKFIPIQSKSAQLFESLAKGGLGSAWGAGAYLYNDDELIKCGLNPNEMNAAYATIFQRIGVTKGNPKNSFEEQESLHVDENIQQLERTYEKKAKALNKKGFHLNRTPLAVITEDKNERKAYQYRDMDFWHDNDQSKTHPVELHL